jgi:hypothetical protein
MVSFLICLIMLNTIGFMFFLVETICSKKIILSNSKFFLQPLLIWEERLGKKREFKSGVIQNWETWQKKKLPWSVVYYVHGMDKPWAWTR